MNCFRNFSIPLRRTWLSSLALGVPRAEADAARRPRTNRVCISGLAELFVALILIIV